MTARPQLSASSWLKNNGLTVALLLLFAVSVTGQVFTGWAVDNQERAKHLQAGVGLAAYLGDPQLWFESFQHWQSEFLSTAVLIVLAIWLREKGSPESKAVSDPHSKTGNN